jgi:hypothetical protein
MTSGYFERVNGHEPLNPPGNGLTAALWVQSMGPVPAGSGLAATSARLVFMVRLFAPAMQLPTDDIDPNLMAATDALMTAYSGDFEFGGQVRNVDLLGQAGIALSAEAGWVDYGDGAKFRVITITLPVIVNNAWTQAP